jgi:tRNA(Arg) A34 adenosine deaminase TadA
MLTNIPWISKAVAIFAVSATSLFSSAQPTLSRLPVIGEISSLNFSSNKDLDVVDGRTLLSAVSNIPFDKDTLQRFRSKTNLSEADDTVAYVTGKGIDKVFGVNSGAQTKAAQELGEANVGLDLRKKYFTRVQNELKEYEGKMMNLVAQPFLHAESHSLMRATERYGQLPKVLVLHVDRPPCNQCAGTNGLSVLVRLFSIDELTVISPSRVFKVVRTGNTAKIVE